MWRAAARHTTRPGGWARFAVRALPDGMTSGRVDHADVHPPRTPDPASHRPVTRAGQPVNRVHRPTAISGTNPGSHPPLTTTLLRAAEESRGDPRPMAASTRDASESERAGRGEATRDGAQRAIVGEPQAAPSQRQHRQATTTVRPTGTAPRQATTRVQLVPSGKMTRTPLHLRGSGDSRRLVFARVSSRASTTRRFAP